MISDMSVIRERGFRALTKELGSSGMVMFIRQFESGSGNYTEEREDLHKDITIDDVVSAIKRRKQQWFLTICRDIFPVYENAWKSTKNNIFDRFFIQIAELWEGN